MKLAALVLVILLARDGQLRTENRDVERQQDPADQPCEVDRTRALMDASVSNPYECRPQESLTPRRSFHSTNVNHGHVSFTTLAAPKNARKAYEKAVRELTKEKPNHAKAAAELERAVRSYPDFAAAWYLLGEARLGLEQNSRAREAFEQALTADPKYPEPYPPLALMELKRGRLAEAARLADYILKFYPHLTEVRFYSAVAHYNLGDSDAARQSISAIVESGDDKLYPRVHVMLGEMFAGEGDFSSAAREYRRLLELEPNSRVAGTVRRQLAEWKARGLIDAPCGSPDCP